MNSFLFLLLYLRFGNRFGLRFVVIGSYSYGLWGLWGLPLYILPYITFTSSLSELPILLFVFVLVLAILFLLRVSKLQLVGFGLE